MSKSRLAEAIKALSYDDMMDFVNCIYEGCALGSFTLVGVDQAITEAEIAAQISVFADENLPEQKD